MSKNFSKFGTIFKRETLASGDLGDLTGYLILHSSDPFPGYYCNEEVPADNSCKEVSYYIPIKEFRIIEDEVYCRISLEIQSRLGVAICPAMFNFEESNIHAFRVKNITEKDLVKLCLALEKLGISLFPAKKIRSYLSYIYLKAFFEIRQISDHFYLNRESEGLFYFSIPEHLEWEDFERIITYQKSHSRFRNFDAATGYWIQKPAFNDFIRIYGNDLDIETLEAIRKDFLRNMKKYKRQGMLI